jgi:hypothetical protein
MFLIIIDIYELDIDWPTDVHILDCAQAQKYSLIHFNYYPSHLHPNANIDLPICLFNDERAILHKNRCTLHLCYFKILLINIENLPWVPRLIQLLLEFTT